MELSICTVSFNSASEIKWNIALAKRLNAKTALHWFVAENSPPDSPERLAETDIDATIVPGATGGHVPTYHHTIALANAISRARTRFVLVLDPDFFVVKNEWAIEMIQHMLANKLSILGVPWHPKLLGKYRYFPAVHCSLFDTERFPIGSIDFRPDYPDGNADPAWPAGYDTRASYFTRRSFTRLLSKLPLMEPRRHFYTDTGGRLFKRYVRDPSVSYEVIDPVHDPTRYRRDFHWSTKVLEKILPDELCYLPKHYRDTRDAGFLHKYVGDSVPDSWQEFIWRGAPFGFHMQRTADTSSRSRQDEVAVVGRIIEFVQRSASIRSPVDAGR